MCINLTYSLRLLFVPYSIRRLCCAGSLAVVIVCRSLQNRKEAPVDFRSTFSRWRKSRNFLQFNDFCSTQILSAKLSCQCNTTFKVDGVSKQKRKELTVKISFKCRSQICQFDHQAYNNINWQTLQYKENVQLDVRQTLM